MIRSVILSILILPLCYKAFTQTIIPLDTNHWTVTAQSHRFEMHEGKNALFIEQGIAMLNDSTFINGTIEFDMYLAEEQSFPGLRFRITDNNNMESFFLRPHLSGKPDANQGAPVINGLTAWQLYFGPSYSFPYTYNFNEWTHVKIVVNGSKCQVYLDNAEKPHLSWNLKHKVAPGKIGIGGSAAPAHYANFQFNKKEIELINFHVIERVPIDNLIPEWKVSDMFEEKLLDEFSNLESLIADRTWGKKILVEETAAANISREILLYNGSPGNTVFAKINIQSDKDQLKLFEFGYSDRAVVLLNGQPLYKGTNKWRSRDYRYLGTIGLFDSVYLDLKKGDNELLLAVSEDFGGWLVTGRFANQDGITIK